MQFNFYGLTFEVSENRIYLTDAFGAAQSKGCGFAEVQVAGENKHSHDGIKTVFSSEGMRLEYVSHRVCANKLTVVQKSALIEVTTTFIGYGDCEAVRVKTQVKNISEGEITLEEVSAFMLHGIGSTDITDKLYFTKFIQSHHTECQPLTRSFRDYGMVKGSASSQRKISFANVGSWSTKEELPQGIIYDGSKGEYLMFQIESNNSWYYELSDSSVSCGFYLYLGGATITNGAWQKHLRCGEVYETAPVALAHEKSLCAVLKEMTKYRRHIAGRCEADESLPTIFNEYMHLSWDSPSAEKTRTYAPVVASLGIKYYVIDCGWHNEEDGNIIYPYVGQWIESKKRFPEGVRSTTDYIRSLGMKPGLWIEPEIIGQKCADMLDYYDDDCFLKRGGRRIGVFGRYFLNYKNPKVAAYMTESIRRMVEKYGAEYIKLDYNQDIGIGCDGDSYGEGLEEEGRAYLEWIDSIRKEFPDVLFETCSSGGLRMDYGTLSHFSIVSTSDQTNYLKYPYIAGNILSAVTPEQAAVWSYPVGSNGSTPEITREWVEENISNEQVAMNMVNSFLGRMHLASHLELLSKKKLALVKEGIEYFDSISNDKKCALPYLPKGFTGFGERLVAAGLETDKKVYLAVWNLDGDKNARIELPDIQPKAVRIAYPSDKRYAIPVRLDGNTLSLEFTDGYQARMLEIDL